MGVTSSDIAASGGQADGLTLERAFECIRKFRTYLIAAPIIAAACAGALVTLIPDRYEASVIVQIDPRQTLAATPEKAAVTDAAGVHTTIESEVQIFKSRPILAAAVESLSLENDAEFAGGGLIAPALANGSAPDHEANSAAVDSAITTLAGRLKATRVRNTLLIDVRVSSTDAAKAARITNTVADAYLNEQLSSKRRASMAAVRLLEDRLETLRASVTESERKVEQWKALNGVFDSEGAILSERQLARLMEQTVVARAATTEARAKYEHVQNLVRSRDNPAALAASIESARVNELRDQIAAGKRALAQVSSKYGARHPEILRRNAEIAEAEAQLQAEINRGIINLKNTTEIAESRERQLNLSLAQLKEQQIISKDASVELKHLERETSATKQLYESILARHKQMVEIQGLQLPNARVVEPAYPPVNASAPKRPVLVAFAGAAALIVAIGGALLFELTATGIRRPADVARMLDVPYLSSMPAHIFDSSQQGTGKVFRGMVADPSSPYADAIRNARRELDARSGQGASRIILVTSSMPGEGAEILASNLAHHLAMSGRNTLLIDADLRLQTLTRQLAPNRRRGLLDQLAQNLPVDRAILRDSVTGLHFLPAASAAPSRIPAAEALGRTAMVAALTLLRSRHDTIVIAAPPLLPVIDARIVADYADQIVVVTAWRRTPRDIVQQALAALGSNRVKIAGVILSEVSGGTQGDFATDGRAAFVPPAAFASANGARRAA